MATESAWCSAIICSRVVCGADLLVEFKSNPDTAAARKVLVTGQAGPEDTIKPGEPGRPRPLRPQTLGPAKRSTKSCAGHPTDYAIDEVEDLLPFVSILEGPRVLEAIKDRRQTE